MRAGTTGALIKTVATLIRPREEIDANELLIEIASGHM